MAPAKALSVAVRCRLMLPHDRDQRECVRAVGPCDIECLDPEHLHVELREINGRPDYLKENHCRERSYTFDAVFGPDATNSILYEQLAAPLLPEVLAGKHATVFAYGQTGSGKTHTMLGRHGEPGIVELTLQGLLSCEAFTEATMNITFVEVYNEKIRDLLVPKCPVLELRDDRWRGPCIAGVTELPGSTVDSVMELVRVGNARRTEEKTEANPVSSRSHAVLQFIVETKMAPGKKRVSKLSLIDLAGSERAASTGNRGARLREGAMINRSLLALANCITALTRKGAYVNYRDSKLTRLLKDSFSGNCFTVMIAHVSPSIASFEETLNTLKYAHRACEIRGMGGGVRENVCAVNAQYADRLRPCLEATVGLKRAVEKLAVPRPPLRRRDSRMTPPPMKSRAVELVDELEKTRQRVVSKMRERIRIEETALELDDQNAMNSIELSQLELDAVTAGGTNAPGVPARVNAKPALLVPSVAQPPFDLLKKHADLLVATRKNDAQRRRVEHQSEKAEQSVNDGKDEARLVSLLTDARNVVAGANNEKGVDEIEKRLLHAQHAISLLEIEKIEAEQGRVVLEAAARKHELALRKQSIQVDVHSRALAVAEKLIAKHGLVQEWREMLGPLAQLLPIAEAGAPSLDELIAEISAPPTPMGPRPGVEPLSQAAEAGEKQADALIRDIDVGFQELRATLGCSLKRAASEDVDDEGAADVLLREIDEGFNEMRVTLGRSLKLPPPSADEADEDKDDSALIDDDDEEEHDDEDGEEPDLWGAVADNVVGGDPRGEGGGYASGS